MLEQQIPDTDPIETKEWLESVDAVVESDGRERAAYLLDRVVDYAQDLHVSVDAGVSTPYVNTIPPEDEPPMPGDPELERLATALVRWNAIAIVLQANAESTELGGHIASYQSAETLYEVGFNHFWRARSENHLGDLVYLQGHSSPGFYARATGIALEHQVDDVSEAAEMIRARRDLKQGGLVFTLPPPAKTALKPADVETHVKAALALAKKKKIEGKAVTPFLLNQMVERTKGKTLAANLALLENNARYAAKVAVAFGWR